MEGKVQQLRIARSRRLVRLAAAGTIMAAALAGCSGGLNQNRNSLRQRALLGPVR